VIAIIKLEGAESSFILCNSRYIWKGEIDNFTVHDTTDYPKTALLKPLHQIQPFCLMSTKEEAQSLLKFNILIWSDDAPDKPTDIGSKIDVEVSSIRMVYIHQPWMRIIDYFNYLMLGLFDSTSRVRDAEHWSPITKLSFLLNLSSIESMSVEGTEQTILNFTKMNITIKEPIIELIPRPNYREKIIFNLGDINISNHQIEVLTRHPTLPVWMDVYRIKMKNLKISVGEDNLSENVNIDMEFQRPLLTFMQSKDINYDQSYGIKVFSSEFPLTLTQAHYCLILKCMDLNMTYDDQLDKYINTDCAPPFTPNDEDPTHGGIFLNIDINIGKLSVLFMNRHKNIAELSFIPFSMKMIKYNDYCMTMNIRSSDALITTNENKHFPVISDARLPSLVLGAFTHQEDMFEFKFNSHWSGNKDMVVTLRDVRMNCHMAVMTQLQYFLYYGMPEYTKESETPLDYMTKYRPLRQHSFNETANEYIAPSIRFKAIFIKPFIVLPNTKGNRLFVSQFNFEFEYFREHEAKFTAQRCPATIKKILAERVELYSCTVQDLTNVRSLDDLKKRKVLDPVTIEYISTENREKKLWDYHSSYIIAINLEKVRINVSHKDIVLFYNILELQNLLQAGGKHLTESLYDKTVEEINVLDEDEPEVNSTTLKLKDSKPVFRRSASKRERSESSDLEEEVNDTDERVRSKHIPKETSHSKEPRYHIVSKTGFNCSDMRIVMINDAAGAYSPVCLFGARDLMLKQENEAKDSTISLSGKFRSNYYNPIADCYEPLIEEFEANLEYVFSELENEMTKIIVHINPELPININFSELATKQTFGIIKAWSENWDSVEENNLRDIVSPFSIMNQCGYMIVVDKTRRSNVFDESSIFTVEQGQTVEYEIDATGARILDFNSEQFTFSVVQFDYELEPIQGITINKVQSINRDVRVNSEEFPLIFSVELIETRKVLKVTSAISVKNELGVRLQLLLHKKSENHEEIAKVCEPDEELYLPFDYVRGEIGLLPDLSYCSDKWHMVDLKEIAGRQSGFHAEIQCNTFYMIMMLQRNKSNPNQRTLIFKPSIVIRNMLPLPLNIGMWSEGKAREISITQGGKHFEYSVSFFQELQVELRLNTFRQSPRIKLVSRKDSPPKSVTVVDISGDPLTILLDYKSQGSRTFTFYVPVSIINNTALPFLYYYHKNGSMRRISGQGDPNVVVPCSNIKNLTIGLEVNKSQRFRVETVGSQKVIEIKGDADREGNYINYQFVYDVQLSSLYPNEYLFTKIITISPRFVLVNNMKEDLIIIQHEVREYPTILHSKTRSPYYWPNGKGQQLINIRVLEGEDRSMYRNFGEGSVWGWSGAIAIDQIGSITLQCRNLKDIRYFKLVRVEIKLIGTSAYVTFEEENEKYCSYRIDNLSKYISIAVYQDKSKNETRWIDTNSSSPFAWTRPLETHRLIVEFYLGSLEEYPVNTGIKYYFKPDTMHAVYKLQVDRTADTGHVIYGYTCNEGSTKVLKFADYALYKEDTEDEPLKLQLTCVIPKFGISVIEHSPSRVGEILYFSMSEIHIMGNQTEKTFQFEVLVNSLQIDTQYNSNAVYPVLLSPNRQASKERQVLHISMGLFMDGNPNCYNFENCEILLQAIVLQLESTFIKKILHLVNRINQTYTFEDPWWLVPRRAPLWCDEAVITLDKKFYFSKFKLMPIRLDLSFMPLKDTEESDVFNTLVKALGMAVTAIESAPLKLSSIEMSDMYGSQSQIISSLLMHYKAQFLYTDQTC
jgi:vacuolar protein sorting-associated protein 13A/C